MRSLSLLFMLGFGLCSTDLQAKPPDKVEFEVFVIHAANKGTPPLDIPKEVHKYLVSTFKGKFNSFELLQRETISVASKKTGKLSLPDGSELSLTFEGQEKDFVRLTMALKGLETTIRIRDGGMFFQAGHKYNKGTLVLAISASTPGASGRGLSTVRPDPRSGHEPQKKDGRSIDPGASK